MGTEHDETNTRADTVQREELHRPERAFEKEDVPDTGDLTDSPSHEKVITIRGVRNKPLSVPYDIEKERVRRENLKANRGEATDET